MRHVPAIAGRELRSLFSAPVAYVVLSLVAVLGGFFFLSHLVIFDDFRQQAEFLQSQESLDALNLNDFVIAPFINTMSVVLLFLVPGVTMGLFANEKSNATEEMLLTSPITIWELVVGKFVGVSIFVLMAVGLLALFPVLLFQFGNPELGKTLSGLLGLAVLGIAYAAVGAFASAVTRSQLIAFFLALTVLLLLLLLGAIASNVGGPGWAGNLLRYLGTAEHFENFVMGLIDTRHLGYFAVLTAIPLILAKASVESVRWR